MTTLETPPSEAPTTDERLPWDVLRVLMGISGLIALVSLGYNFFGDWSIWKQGDWLINSVNVQIRRGPSGTAIIDVADALNVSPVTVVIGLQVVLVLVLYGSYYLAARGLADGRVALLLSCSPAMFLVFWPANIYHGALRKEILGITAVVLLLVYLRKRQVGWVVAAGVVMAAGVWAHEIVILFGPVFLYVAWRGYRLGLHRTAIAVVAGVAALSGVLAGVYVMLHTDVDQAAVKQVCAPLLERGVRCDPDAGPFKFLALDSADTWQKLKNQNLNAEGLGLFAIGAALGAAPLVYLTTLLQKRKVAVLGVLFALPMLPLFAVVIDWGRWLSCGVVAFVAVLMAHALTDDLPLRRRPSLPVVLGLVVLGAVIAPHHVDDLVPGGLFAHSWSVVHDFVSSL